MKASASVRKSKVEPGLGACFRIYDAARSSQVWAPGLRPRYPTRSQRPRVKRQTGLVIIGRNVGDSLNSGSILSN